MPELRSAALVTRRHVDLLRVSSNLMCPVASQHG
ncbi:MAG TPA: putative leader peptide [Segeticoccus sp.]|nr:putative leader peptide [Segeticoccus sp.]HET8600945.1 putative leader peptide [Segeticoccus sp.]